MPATRRTGSTAEPLGGPACGAGSDPAATPVIDCRAVCQVFERNGEPTVALQDLDLQVRRGEFIALVGPSGCGKSTFLNLASGLQMPSAGTLHYAGEPVTGINTRAGYVPQGDTLLPWRSVHRNLAFPLEVRGVPKREQQERIAAALRQIGLEGFERHYPAELSGGMRKRVQLARTLIYQPETLFMDEPFAAVDAQLRQSLQTELLERFSGRELTVVFVTHDLEEAIMLADRVAVFTAHPGRVHHIHEVDIPRPRDVYSLKTDEAFLETYQRLLQMLVPDVRAGGAR